MRTSFEVRLGPGDRDRLEAIVGSRNTPQKHVWRARIVLLSADGMGTMEIQRRTGKGKPTIWRWQRRFMDVGVDGLLRDATRPGRKPPLAPSTIERIVEMTLAAPPGEATHWTGRTMAKAAAVSYRSVQRIWAAHGRKRLKRGAFSGIADLQAAINGFLAEANECPKPFVWTADPDGIIEKVRRGEKVLASIGLSV